MEVAGRARHRASAQMRAGGYSEACEKVHPRCCLSRGGTSEPRGRGDVPQVRMSTEGIPWEGVERKDTMMRPRRLKNYDFV